MRTETLFDRMSRATHAGMFGIAFVALRVVLGLQFFLSGFDKLSDWSASAYLVKASGPFASWFQAMAGNPLVDALNAWGMLLIGVALLLGLFVRPAALAGALLMLLFYFASFAENTAHGYIDMHIVYLLVLLLFAAGGAGHAFGVNAFALRTLRRPNAFARFVLG